MDKLFFSHATPVKVEFNEFCKTDATKGLLYLVGGPVGCGKSIFANYKKYRIIRSQFSPRTAINVDFLPTSSSNSGIGIYRDITCSKQMDVETFLNFDFTKYEVIIVDGLHVEIARKLEEEDYTYACIQILKDLAFKQHKTVIVALNDFWHTGEPVWLFHSLMLLASKIKILRGECDFCTSLNASASYYHASINDTGFIHTEEEDKIKWAMLCPSCWMEHNKQKT